MSVQHFQTVILGPSITSTWENGHATIYRNLVRELSARSHDILFLERNSPWRAENRDLPEPPYCRTEFHYGIGDLKQRFRQDIQSADCVIVGSSVPDGVAVGEWVTSAAPGITVFHDLDTPRTMAKIRMGDCDYLSADLISQYDLYFSSSGGRTLDLLEGTYRAPRAKPLHGMFDAQLYYPDVRPFRWDLGYIGTSGDDREPHLRRIMLDAAARWPGGRFAVAGAKCAYSQFWPVNVERIGDLTRAEHRAFYNSQRFTLDTASYEMVRAGHSPSTRLFEAAACGSAIISDYWEGVEEFFEPGREILIARSANEILEILHDMTNDERMRVAEAALQRVNRQHTAAHRAKELEAYVEEAMGYSQDHSLVSGGLCAWQDGG